MEEFIYGKIGRIDLGTTNSCVAIIEGGQPTIIPNRKEADNSVGCSVFQKRRKAGGPDRQTAGGDQCRPDDYVD